MSESDTDGNKLLADGNGDSVAAAAALNSSSELGPLSGVSELIVKQKRDIIETLRGTEEPNVYWIYNKLTNEKLYTAQEELDCCGQQCCGAHRSFSIRLFDKFNREVILLERALNFDYCCGWGCCLDRVNVSIRNYKSRDFEWVRVGSVKQNWNPIFPTFSICDENGDTQVRVKGPFLTSACFSNVNFRLEPKGGGLVGSVKKYWHGLCTELTSDADLFGITFPEGLTEKMRATLLGVLFLIDFKYYESSLVLCC